MDRPELRDTIDRRLRHVAAFGATEGDVDLLLGAADDYAARVADEIARPAYRNRAERIAAREKAS